MLVSLEVDELLASPTDTSVSAKKSSDVSFVFSDSSGIGQMVRVLVGMPFAAITRNTLATFFDRRHCEL
jgi:hypothetical protein